MVMVAMDRELVRRAADGDRSAFAMLVREYGPRAVNLAHQLIGDRDLANEVAQEALVKAWTHLRQLKDDGAFYPWLARIVVNQARNLHRSRSKGPMSATDVDAEMSLDDGPVSAGGGMTAGRRINDEFQGPLKSAQAEELRKAMDIAITELPFNYRSALMMFSVDGLSHAEIAAGLDVPEQTVRWRVHQARKMLREKLKDYLD